MPINKKSDRGSGSGKNSSSNVEIHTDSYLRSYEYREHFGPFS